jgi:hypothetical protein
MKKKHIKIILIFLFLYLFFLFRWSIIDSFLFTFVSSIKPDKLKTYTSTNLGFSGNYPLIWEGAQTEITENDNNVAFGNWVVPLLIVRIGQDNNRNLKDYISEQKEKENKSLNWFAKWDIFLLPALGSRGYSLNFVAGNPVFTISSPALAGAGGRLFRTYYTAKGKIYAISSTSYLSQIGKYRLYKQFLRDFKPL